MKKLDKAGLEELIAKQEKMLEKTQTSLAILKSKLARLEENTFRADLEKWAAEHAADGWDWNPNGDGSAFHRDDESVPGGVLYTEMHPSFVPKQDALEGMLTINYYGCGKNADELLYEMMQAATALLNQFKSENHSANGK